MAERRRFGLPSLFAALAFFALGYAAAIFSPVRASLAPETRSLVARLHVATLARHRDSLGRIDDRKRLALQAARLAQLEASGQQYRAAHRSAVGRNALLLDSLERMVGDTTARRIVTALGLGIADQGRACEGAIAACDSVQGLLRGRIASDSLRLDSLWASEGRTLRLAGDATGGAVRWERAAAGYRRQRNVVAVLAALGLFGLLHRTR